MGRITKFLRLFWSACAIVALGACSSAQISTATFGLLGEKGQTAERPATRRAPSVAARPAPAAADALDIDETMIAGAPAPAPPSGTVVALLVPLSGTDTSIGRTMLEGAEVAVFGHAGESFEIRPYDTKGTPEGAEAAAGRALADGARLVLGPVFAPEVAAVAPLARAASVNVIAFTNDASAAGEGVFVLGYLLEPQIDTVVAFARARGVRRFAALVPDDVFGSRAAEALIAATKAHGGELRHVITYADNVDSIDAAVRRLAGYDAGKAARREARAELAAQGRAGALAAVDALKTREPPGSVDFEALLVPSGNESVRAIAARLPYYDIPTSQVRVLGISTWERLDLRAEPALEGAWYATPQSDARLAFAAEYAAQFGAAPGFLAALAYDATAMAALLARREGGPDFSVSALTDPRGFDGASGLFRFRRDGRSERAYAVSEIAGDGVKLVEQARRSFDQPVAAPADPERQAIW